MTDSASALKTPSQSGRSNAAAQLRAVDPPRAGRFSAALRQMALAGSLAPAGSNPTTTPTEADPSAADAGDAAQPTPDDAQASRLTARKSRSASNGRHDKNSTDSDQGGSPDGPDAATEIPSQPLTIASLNDLLLFADPAVLSMRGIQLPRAAAPAPPLSPLREESRGSSTEPPPSTGPRGAVTGGPAPTQPTEAPAQWSAQPTASAPDVAARSDAAASGNSAPSQADPAKAFDAPSRASPTVTPQQPVVSPAGAVLSTAIPESPRIEPTSASAKPAIDGIRPMGPASSGSRLFQVREQESAGQSADPADESPFAAQLSRGLAAAMAQRPDGSDDGPRSITLRLQPESLGKVRIDVGVDGQAVTARFEAATPEARDLLTSSLATLRSSLEERGLNVQHLHVTLASTDAAPGVIAGPHPSEPQQPPAWNAGQHPNSSAWSGAGQSQSNDRQSRSEGDAERRRPPAVEPLPGPVGRADHASTLAAAPSSRPLGGAAAYGTRVARSSDPGTREVSLLLGIDTLA